MIYKSKKATKDGRSYFFRIKYRDVLGVQHDYSSPKYLTKKEASLEEAKYKLELSNTNNNSSNVNLDRAFAEYISSKKSQIKPQSILKSQNQYKYISCIGNVKINSLNYSHIKLLKSNLDKHNIAVEYKNKILGLFIRIIKFSNRCYNTQLQIINLVDRYKNLDYKKQEMKFFTLEEYQKFRGVIDDNEKRLFFDCLYFLGLRKSEAFALTWNDIDFKKEVVEVNKQITRFTGHSWSISAPKTQNSTRILPIPKVVLEGLKWQKKAYSKYNNFKSNWFVFGGVNPLAPSTITECKNKYCKLAKVKQIRIHDFRHSCASLLINKGASIQLVSKYLGHANINITLKTYTHLYKSELDNIKNVLDQIKN